MPSLPLPEFVRPYEGQTKTLTADELAVFKKELVDEIHALRTLMDVGKDGTVELGLAHTVLSLGESHRDRLCKVLGIEMDGKREREERHARLRQANGRIRELEALLGQSAGPEALSMFMKELAKRIDHWWDVEGFGYVREMNLGKWGTLTVEFGCSLYSGARSFSDTPVSDERSHEQWLQELVTKGYQVRFGAGGNDPYLEDSDQNRALLQKLFSRFKGARLLSTGNQFVKTGLVLRDCKVHFDDLAELHALPLPEHAGA